MSEAPNPIPFHVFVGPMLSCGGVGWRAEGIFIMIADDLTQEEAVATAWHEVIHLLRSARGEKPKDAADLERIEAEVDAAAKTLAAACPDILEWLGIAKRFK